MHIREVLEAHGRAGKFVQVPAGQSYYFTVTQTVHGLVCRHYIIEQGVYTLDGMVSIEPSLTRIIVQHGANGWHNAQEFIEEEEL